MREAIREMMDEQDFDYAEHFWEEKDAQAAQMPQDELRVVVDAFLSVHNTLALACGTGDFVRCTPLEYTWLDGCLWVFSEGGEKFRALRENRKVCAAVFEPYGSGKLQSVQLAGVVEFPDAFGPEYLKLLDHKGIPRAVMEKMPRPMPLLKIVPQEADVLDSGFKERGYGSRQHLELRA